MTRCVALLRGIGPGNPNMRNEHLRRVCEDIGLGNVSTVISSGNVVFDTDSDDLAALETTLERAWPEELGFESTTIVRTAEDLERLTALEPFGGLEHGKETYLLVTFAKRPLTIDLALPHQPDDPSFRLVGATDRELFSVTDTTATRTPNVMGWIEDLFGKDLTSRTWLTVSRILKKMG
ncbi:MAG TPA: DUF1697 domain-containing protein [Acidimicrobiia bacterium]|nr:DUF1697 domain-containing protein [Acidimicrobiia bacterium]